MKISECTVCWTPDMPQYAPGMRAKARIFPATAAQEDIAPFPYRAGRCHSRGLDPRLEVRQAYALEVALVMVARDHLDLWAVHRMMMLIEEYASGCAEDLAELTEAPR